MQCVAWCETRSPPGGIETAENTDYHRDSDGHHQKLRIQLWLEQSTDGWHVDEELHSDDADQRSAEAAEKSEQRRFPQNHAHDPAAFPPDGEKHANLLSALEDSHEHRVHHSQ